MDASSVRGRVEAIAAVSHDAERAHSEEDELHLAVLRAIADGAPGAADLAREALRASELSFSRWCA